MLQKLALQVHCKICKRNGSHDDSFVQRFKTGNMFTHHQKAVVLDAAGFDEGPKVDFDSLNKGMPHSPACVAAATANTKTEAWLYITPSHCSNNIHRRVVAPLLLLLGLCEMQHMAPVIV